MLHFALWVYMYLLNILIFSNESHPKSQTTDASLTNQMTFIQLICGYPSLHIPLFAFILECQYAPINLLSIIFDIWCGTLVICVIKFITDFWSYMNNNGRQYFCCCSM